MADSASHQGDLFEFIPVGQRKICQKIIDILQPANCDSRFERLRALRDKRPREMLDGLMILLKAPDPNVRRGAGASLGYFRGELAEKAPVLIEYLHHHEDARVRLSCAIHLMSVRDPMVDRAYLTALKSSSEKVAQLACFEVGYRGGAAGAAALFEVLNHLSWRVRLEACRGLIRLYERDGSWIPETPPPETRQDPPAARSRAQASALLVAALEKMSSEPEAAVYDAECDDFQLDVATISEMAGQIGLTTPEPPAQGSMATPEPWGKVASIVQRARRIAQQP
jgi:HEAT repeat protein